MLTSSINGNPRAGVLSVAIAVQNTFGCGMRRTVSGLVRYLGRNFFITRENEEAKTVRVAHAKAKG